MAEEQHEWIEGREFRVDSNILNNSGVRVAIPGYTYVVKTPFTFFNKGFPDQAVRIIADTKQQLLNHIVWRDEKIGPLLKALIRDNPKGRLLRGLVRAEVNQIMPSKETPDTFEGWMKWLKELPEPDKVESAPAATVVVEPERQVAVRVDATERLYIRRTGQRVDRYRGLVNVPISVLSGGADEVMDWMYDHIRDYINPIRGTTTFDEGEEVSDSDGLSIGSIDAQEVISRLEREGAFRGE